MVIARKNLTLLSGIFQRISNSSFDINTQYKLLKMKKAIMEEESLYIEQLENLKIFCLKDEQGKLITTSDGGYAIDPEKAEECANIVQQINALQIQVPDMYFSLEELEPLNLTFKELEALEPFIKI